MEVELVCLEIKKLFVNEIEMSKTCLELSLFQERFANLDNVPVILKLIETGIISHEGSKHIFSNIWFLTFHQVLDTNIVHVSISKIHLSGFIDCLQTF